MKNNNLDFIINGEIYLKRGPEIYNSNDEINVINDLISDIEFDMTKKILILVNTKK